MARNRFGGAAYTFVVAAGGPGTAYKRLATPPLITCWSGPPTDLGRVMYDDLRALDDSTTVINQITALPNGDFPEFYGPDDVTVLSLWVSADGGDTGTWIAANDPSQAIDAAMQEAKGYADEHSVTSYENLTDKPTIPATPADIGALPNTYTPPDASTSTKGLTRYATDDESITGTATERSVNPRGLKAAFDSWKNVLLGGASTAYDTLKEIEDKLTGEDSVIAGMLATIGGKLDANQREVNSGIAGLTSSGKIYEARVPDRLSDASLTAAFVPGAALAVVVGNDQAAIDAAFAKVVTTGGVVIFPPGDYTGKINITANAQIGVYGYGAILKAQTNGATLLRISQLNGGNALGCTVQGLKLDGNGKTGLVGVAFEDTDGAYVRDLYVKNCATGVLFHNAGSGKWVERCTLADSFITGATTGIEFKKETGAMPSFNEVSFVNVGASQCSSIGIKQGAGCDFTRTTWDNVTVWCPDGAIGVEFDGRLDYARLQFGIESLGAGTGSTAIHIGPDYTFYADPWAHTLEVSIVGTFATKIADDSANGVVLRDGSNATTTKYAAVMIATKLGDAFPRLRMGTAGIEVGDGASAPVMLAQSFYGAFYKSFVSMLFQSEPGFPVANATGGSASKSARIHDITDAWAGYLPVYSTSDGPALVPSSTQTGTAYTLVAADAGKAVTMNNASAQTLTVPPNSSVAFTTGTVISVENLGAGVVSIAAGAGVTIRSRGSLLNLAGQYAAASLRKIGTNEWLLAGDLV